MSSTDSGVANSMSNDASSFQTAKAAVDKTVSKLTSKNKIFPIFKEHLQPYYRNDTKSMQGIFESMMNQLDSMMKDELDLLFESSNLEQHLTTLDGIKAESKKLDGSKTWRPSGNPQEDVSAHLQESSAQEVEHLEKMLAVLLSKNKWLNENAQRVSSRNSSSVRAFDDVCTDWEQAASAISKDSKADIVNIVHGFSGVNFLEEEPS